MSSCNPCCTAICYAIENTHRNDYTKDMIGSSKAIVVDSVGTGGSKWKSSESTEIERKCDKAWFMDRLSIPKSV